MIEIFFKMITSDEEMLIWRFISLPVITLMMYYLFLLIYVRLNLFNIKSKLNDYLVKVQIAKMYSINSVLLIINLFWFYLLYNNNISQIDWNFTFDLSNIYLQLTPFLLSNIILVILYNRTKKTILKII
jgi:hypothetical protein